MRLSLLQRTIVTIILIAGAVCRCPWPLAASARAAAPGAAPHSHAPCHRL